MSTKALLEAVLFIYGEPMPIKNLAKLINKDEKETLSLVYEFQSSLENENRGLVLVINNGKIQLATKKEFGGVIEKLLKAELHEDLTPAASETLAIIGYLGPVSKSRIDYLRGVNSLQIIRNLILRGLIEKSTDSKKSSIFLYSLSTDFLRHLGLTDIRFLPEYEKYSQLSTKLIET